MKYIVQCTATLKTTDGWSQTAQIPTFFLDSDVQGFKDVQSKAAAKRVAKAVVDPFNMYTVSVSVEALD